MPKYPDIRMRLSGKDGNAFFILARVRKALQRANVPATDIEAFTKDAMASTYDHLLQTCMQWVTCT